MVQVCLGASSCVTDPSFSQARGLGHVGSNDTHTQISGESEKIHPLNTRVLSSVSGYVQNCTNILLESIHSTLQDIRFAAPFVLPSLPTECSSAYSSNTRGNSGLSWMVVCLKNREQVFSCTILLDSGEAGHGRVPTDFLRPPAAQLVCTE